MKFKETKDKINKVFRELRKQGLLCKQNFHCCSGCATSALTSYFANTPNTKYKGVAYFHKQDMQYFLEDGQMTIRFCAVDDNEAVTVQIGKLITEQCNDAGLTVEWKGTAGFVIQVS